MKFINTKEDFQRAKEAAGAVDVLVLEGDSGGEIFAVFPMRRVSLGFDELGMLLLDLECLSSAATLSEAQFCGNDMLRGYDAWVRYGPISSVDLTHVMEFDSGFAIGTVFHRWCPRIKKEIASVLKGEKARLEMSPAE